jgi:hypothetical protein
MTTHPQDFEYPPLTIGSRSVQLLNMSGRNTRNSPIINCKLEKLLFGCLPNISSIIIHMGLSFLDGDDPVVSRTRTHLRKLYAAISSHSTSVRIFTTPYRSLSEEDGPASTGSI